MGCRCADHVVRRLVTGRAARCRAATAPLADLQADREDHLYGWTQDNTSSTAEVTFTVATLGAMTPGEVFYFSGYEENPDRDVYTTGVGG